MLACCVSGVMNPIAICLSLVMCLKSYGIGSGSFFFGVFGFAPLPQMSSLVQILEDLGEEVKLKRLWKGALFVRIWIYGWKQVQKSSKINSYNAISLWVKKHCLFSKGFLSLLYNGTDLPCCISGHVALCPFLVLLILVFCRGYLIFFYINLFSFFCLTMFGNM